MLTGALRQLFALSESLPRPEGEPELPRSLQEELTSTEDRIAYARQFYNDSVQKYNTRSRRSRRSSSPGCSTSSQARVLRGRAGIDRGAEGPVLATALRRSLRSVHAVSEALGVRTDRREQTQDRSVSSSCFVVVAVAVGARVQLLPAGRRRRLRDRRGHRDRLVVRLVLQQRQGRARDGARQAGRSAAVRPLPQPRRGAVHRERAARSRGSTSSTIPRRTRSRPVATRSTRRSRSPPVCSRR